MIKMKNPLHKITSLAEIKALYLDSKIKIQQIPWIFKRDQNIVRELNELYNNELLNIMDKLYLYLNDFDISVAICENGKKRRLQNFVYGYRKYCDNRSSCECNKFDFDRRIENRTDEDRYNITVKRKQTNIEKYGAEFASLLDEYKEKTANTCIEKYGVKAPTCLLEIQQKVSETIVRNFGKKKTKEASKESKRFLAPIINYCIAHNIKIYFDDNEYVLGDPITKKRYLYDLVIPSHNICIEYNGEQYHPNYYKLSEIEWQNWKCKRNNEIMTADEMITYDHNKAKMIFNMKGFNTWFINKSNHVEYISMILKLLSK